MISFAAEFAPALLRTTICLSVAIALAALALRLFRVASPAIHRLCWMLALAVGWTFFQLPVDIAWYEPIPPAPEVSTVVTLPPAEASSPILDLPPLEPVPAALPIAGAPLVDVVLPTDDPPLVVPTPGPEQAVAALPLVSPSPLQPAPPSLFERAKALPWPALLIGVWATGMVVLVALWTLGYLTFVRRIARASQVPDWERQWQTLLTAEKVSARIPLRVTASIGPLLCRLPSGYRLIVPAELWAELDADARLSILRHELAHYRRGDVWKSIACRLLALPHWFNPCAWFAARRFDEAAEWACDLAVAQAEQPTAYARMLLALGEGTRRNASYSPAFRGSTLASRIRRLVQPPGQDSAWKRVAIAGLALAFLSLAAVRVALVAKEPEVPPQPPIPAAQDPFAQEMPPNEESEAHKLAPLDVLRILVEGTPPDAPINGRFLVEPDGQIVLPAGYGRVRVAGLTREMAEQQIDVQLRKTLAEPRIVISLGERIASVVDFDTSSRKIMPRGHYRVQIAGLNEPFDQRVMLDDEGRLVLRADLPVLTLRGKMIEQAETELKAALAKIVSDPKVMITPTNLGTGTSTLEQVRQVRPGLALKVQVSGTPPDAPIDEVFIVQRPGIIGLGPLYGYVEASGTTAEVEKQIEKHLSKLLSNPRAAVSLAGWRPEDLAVNDLANSFPPGAIAPTAEPAPEIIAAREDAEAVVAAARETYGVVYKSYEADKAPISSVIEWSERWLNAALATARNANERVEAAQSHLKRINELYQRVEELNKAQAQGGEHDKLAAMKYHVAVAKGRLREVERQAAIPRPGETVISLALPDEARPAGGDLSRVVRPVTISGPREAPVDEPALFTITVANTTDKPQRNLKVQFVIAADNMHTPFDTLEPTRATGGYKLSDRSLDWTFDELSPGLELQIQAELRGKEPNLAQIPLLVALEVDGQPGGTAQTTIQITPSRQEAVRLPKRAGAPSATPTPAAQPAPVITIEPKPAIAPLQAPPAATAPIPNLQPTPARPAPAAPPIMAPQPQSPQAAPSSAPGRPSPVAPVAPIELPAQPALPAPVEPQAQPVLPAPIEKPSRPAAQAPLNLLPPTLEPPSEPPLAEIVRQLTIEIPDSAQAGENMRVVLVVSNPRGEPLEKQIVAFMAQSPEDNESPSTILKALRATEGYEFHDGGLQGLGWKIESLAPRETRRFQIEFACLAAGEAVLTAQMGADGTDVLEVNQTVVVGPKSVTVPPAYAAPEPTTSSSAGRPTASPYHGLPTSDRAKPDDEIRYAGKTFDEWAHTLKHDLSPESRAQAIRALTAFGARGRGADAARLIFEAMADYDTWSYDSSPEGELKQAALNAFAQIGDVEQQRLPREDSIAVALRALGGDARNVRSFGIQVLLLLAAKEATQPIFQVSKDSDPVVRNRALQALSSLDPKSQECKEAVRAGLRDDDTDTFLYAVGMIVYAGNTAPRLSRAEFESDLPGIVPKLAALATEPIGDVQGRNLTRESLIRCRATIALGNLGPVAKEALPALEKLAESPDAAKVQNLTGVIGMFGGNSATLASLATEAVKKIRDEPASAPQLQAPQSAAPADQPPSAD